jgi:flagellar hook-associated protein 2
MLDVNALVTNILNTEKIPQNNLKSSLTAEQAKLAAYQDANMSVKSLQNSVNAVIGSVYNDSPTWETAGVSSSSSSIAATASGTATTGAYSFDVTRLATSQTELFDDAHSATDSAATGSVTISGPALTNPVVLNNGPYTLATLANEINKSASGVKAGLIQTSTGSYRLKLSSAATGSDHSFTVTGLDGLGTSLTTTATDARIDFGSGANDYVTSSSNTFSDVFPGVTFTVSQRLTGATLTVADDVSKMSDQVQAIVDSLNNTHTLLKSDTTYNATDKGVGLLMSDSSLRTLIQDLPNAFLSTIPSLQTDLGISIDKYGVMSFDRATFATAMTTDASSTKVGITAWAKSLGALTKGATAAASGSVWRSISSAQTRIESFTNKISDWDDKLATRKTQLTTMYSSINATLATLKTTSDWLSDQITALTTASKN